MKIFFYKSVLVFVLFILAVHFSFGLITKQLKKQYIDVSSKDTVEKLKYKIKEELENGSKKDILINPEDAKLINKIIKKIKEDIEKNK